MSNETDIGRRILLKGLAASSLIPLLGSNLIACSDGSDKQIAGVLADFLHGIASGDPLVDRVIIWTRLTPEEEGPVNVSWQVSADEQFNDIVASGDGVTTADTDYTVKVDVEGLRAGSQYYYRFLSGERTSPTGRTRTLPAGAVSEASFAVVSCSNYPAGFFNVYREVANQELDAVLHLGDYLYEYDADGFASSRAEEFGRVVQPPNELLVIGDYRTRYAQYRSDLNLQAAHAAHPFIVVWDDHEVANDTWREGAENHDPATEGDFTARKLAAIQAWYEWLPVRPPSNVEEIIYRRFQFGDLLDLLMLDTRIVGRDKQLSYVNFATDGVIDVPQARAAFGDGNRTLLGADQLQWLRENLMQSSAQWQVIGQQVLFGRYQLPAPIMEALDPSLAATGSLAKGVDAVLASVAAKNKLPADRTAEEQALLDSAIPYNLDAWDGYEYERDRLLEYAASLDAKLVVLAGDTHNAWSSQLTTPSGAIVGVEFGCAGVSSTGLESVLGEDNANLFSPLVVSLVDDLKQSNLALRGYLHLRVTPESVEASHRFVSTVFSMDYMVDTSAEMNASVQRADMLLS